MEGQARKKANTNTILNTSYVHQIFKNYDIGHVFRIMLIILESSKK